MDVTTLKQRAARQERDGDLADAIATYREILDHLEGSPAMKRELPVIAKVGDLLLETGNTKAAVGMYERAAQHYAEHGSAKSITVLCLKVLRADRTQTDVYFRFSQGLLEQGHVDATLVVLVDYAKRAKLSKMLTRLEGLAGRPEQEARHHLEQLFTKVARRARPPSPTPAPPEVPQTIDESQAALEEEVAEAEVEEEEPEEVEGEEPEEEAEVAKGEAEPRPSIVTSDITHPADAELEEPAALMPTADEPSEVADEAPTEEAAAPPAEPVPVETQWYEEPAERELEPEPEPVRASPEPEPVVSVPEPEPVVSEPESEPVAASTAPEPSVSEPEPEGPSPEPEVVAAPAGGEPHADPAAEPVLSRERDVLFSGLGYGTEKSRPAWLWPTVAAVVVVVGGSGLAVLLTGNGTEPAGGGGVVQDSLPATTATGSVVGDPSPGDSAVLPLTTVDSAILDAAGAVPGSIPASVEDTARAEGAEPVPPPPSGADTFGQAGGPPAVAPADTGTPEPPQLIIGPIRAERVLIVEGLDIQSVEDLPSATGGYRVVQTLASGEGLALTVVPIDRAGPIVGGGALRVGPLRGDSAIGTVRFGEDLVTARASTSPSVLEGLLRQLVEIERP